MIRTSCLWHALDLWHTEGGYIVFRRSEHWCMPHVLHISTKTGLSHFVPPGKLDAAFLALFGFEGAVLLEDAGAAKPIALPCMLFGTLALLLLGGVWAVRTMIKKLLH